METFNHQKIDKKWQDQWEKDQLYKTSDKPKNKKYILDMFPYPSGAGLHVGHPEGYTATDILSRFLRMNGHDVLHPMGWDAFGLPAENYAIKEGVAPAISTAKNINRFREQIKSIGLSYDWSREVNTSSPDYYRWTQWLFIQLYKKGLAYKKEANVNWCPKDQTVLANEQVVNGCCERCGTPVTQKLLSQWFFKITDYADRLLNDMDKLDWPEPIKLMQKNWIGKSEGAEIDFRIKNEELRIKNCLVIHGVMGNSKENWFPWLKKTLEKQDWVVAIPDLPNSDHPVVVDWNEELTKELKEGSIVVGHSLGAPAALNAIQTSDKKVRTLILVAPVNPEQDWKHLKSEYSDVDWDAVRSFAEVEFDWGKIRSLVGQVVVYYSDNDPYVPEKSIEFYKKHFPEAVYKFMPGKMHFSKSTAGMIEFPEILDHFAPKIKVFTTRPDTLFGATYMVLAPEHPLVSNLKPQTSNLPEVEKYIETTKKKTEIQRTALEKDKTGVELKGVKVINPATKEEIPVWIADYVLNNYGTGAIMAVPAHDERDFAFAKKYKLPIIRVITEEKPGFNIGIKAWTGEGMVVNSDKFDGMKSEQAREAITKFVGGQKKVQYKLRDWLVSRQRYWGAPIPIIYCDKCGGQAVPEKDLPVLLPTDVDFLPTGESPIARSKSFHKVKCPKCGESAKRDSDTMDTFVDSSWYFFRFTDPHNDKEWADKKAIKSWLPVDTYVGGAEHAVLHLLYARFFTKALADLKFIDFEEPFTKLRNQGLILGPDGEKMSKSRGNVINPDDVIAEFGADAFRMYEMFMGPLEDVKPWSTTGIVGLKRFLDKVWRGNFVFATPHLMRGKQSQSKDKIASSQAPRNDSNIHKLIKKITSDIEQFKFNTAIAAFMEFLNENKQLAKDNWETFLILLAPFAPHITEELWHQLDHKDSVHKQVWPKYDEELVKEESVTVVVQVLGRVRASLVVPSGSDQTVVKKLALADANVKKHLEGKEIVKEVFVQDRLINFVVK